MAKAIRSRDIELNISGPALAAFLASMAAGALLTALVLGPACLCMGATLPLLVRHSLHS